jgi:copper chaperone CopZ
MKQSFKVHGMHCMGCISTIEKALYQVSGIRRVTLSLDTHSLEVESSESLPFELLAQTVANAGAYSITQQDDIPALQSNKSSFYATYKPLLLIAAYLLGISSIVSIQSGVFDGMLWMRVCMGGFFLVFSFFKLLDIKGFVQAYRSYDLLAGQWPFYGYVYAYLELLLGLGYIAGLDGYMLSWCTLVLMSVSTAGVVNALMRKQTIACACLGTVFNLPMSKVTLIEDLLMVAMAAIMLVV